jgi:tetratricopeptide (TPR) repeat protein
MTTIRKRIEQAFSGTMAALLAAGCTSVGPGARDEALAPTKDGGATVVIQPGQEEPVVATHDRQYYLQQRRSKDPGQRLRGSLATGEAEAAIQLAKARLAKQPGDVEALTMLTSALALTKNYTLAAYYAGQLQRLQPGSPVALNIKGLAVMLSPKARLGDFKTAVGYFQEAFSADESQIAPGLNLGNLQLELGNAAAAAETFSQVAGRCGQCVAGLMGEGIALARSREYKKAEAAFQAVLSKRPNHAGALYNLALVYRNGYNNPKQAEKYLYSVLNDSHTKNVALKERAQVVLRMIKGEATRAERTEMADDEAPAAQAGKETVKDDPKDAELLMTGAAGDSE